MSLTRTHHATVVGPIRFSNRSNNCRVCKINGRRSSLVRTHHATIVFSSSLRPTEDKNRMVCAGLNRSAARAQTDDDKLLATLEERGRQSMELQNKLINLIKPEKPANEREAYGDWAKSVMVGLHPTLWRQFQAEQSVLLARYLDFDDRARGTEAQQLSQQKSQCDPQWQPAPQNWPQTVANPTSVWNSRSTSWVQKAMNPGSSIATTISEPTANTPENALSELLEETPLHCEDQQD